MANVLQTSLVNTKALFSSHPKIFTHPIESLDTCMEH